jgi:hypothetical protein
MITPRSTLSGFASASITVLWKGRAMAVEWTAERFEAHITGIFDDVEAKGKAATTSSEVDSLQDRLNEEWYGAKPGAFLPGNAFDRLQTRLGEVSKLLTERFVALKKTSPEEQGKFTILIEQSGPTLDNFFYAPHYSNADCPSDASSRAAAINAVESRLGVTLPPPLRDLYARQNGGHTDFSLATQDTDPAHEFVGEASVIINQAYDVWLTVVPGQDIAPLETLKTLGAFSDAIDFGGADESWRTYLPEIERLIPISNHGSDIWLCLDYRDGRTEPKVVLFDDTRGDRSGENIFAFEAPDFATFFAQLKRHAITVENGRSRRGGRTLKEKQ